VIRSQHDDLSQGLMRTGPSPAEDLSALGTWLGRPVPADLRRFYEVGGGAEGFLPRSESYVALWEPSVLRKYNELGGFSEFAPGLVVIGTDGGGEAFGVDLRDWAVAYVVVPLIGISWERADRVGETLEELLTSLQSASRATHEALAPQSGSFGKMVVSVTPILLGGDPTGPSNQRLVTVEEALTNAKWWNREIRKMLADDRPA
jgi:hypothetical protein